MTDIEQLVDYQLVKEVFHELIGHEAYDVSTYVSKHHNTMFASLSANPCDAFKVTYMIKVRHNHMYPFNPGEFEYSIKKAGATIVNSEQQFSAQDSGIVWRFTVCTNENDFIKKLKDITRKIYDRRFIEVFEEALK